MEVGELRAELDRVIRDDGNEWIPQPGFISKADFPFLRIVNIWQASEALRKVGLQQANCRKGCATREC